MTVYATRLVNGTDSMARMRRTDALGLFPSGAGTARGGFRNDGGGVVTVNAGTMTVAVSPFMAYVDGGVSDVQGGYTFVSDATETLTVNPGHASLSRTDVVIAEVRDTTHDGSGSTDARLRILEGTPGAGVPALPTNALALRNITVPAGLSAGTGGLASGNLSTDRRSFTTGLGGVLTVASEAERDALPGTASTLVYRTDTDDLEVRRASGWERLIPESETAVRDTGLRDITSLASAAFRSSYPNSKVYVQRIGNVVYVNVALKDNAAGASVTVMASATEVFPAGFRVPQMTVTGGRRQAVGLTFNNDNGGIGGAQLLVTNSTYATDLAMYGIAAGVTATSLIVFTTTEAWPATLPGVAA